MRARPAVALSSRSCLPLHQDIRELLGVVTVGSADLGKAVAPIKADRVTIGLKDPKREVCVGFLGICEKGRARTPSRGSNIKCRDGVIGLNGDKADSGIAFDGGAVFANQDVSTEVDRPVEGMQVGHPRRRIQPILHDPGDCWRIFGRCRAQVSHKHDPLSDRP